jgi:CubicO group peptidase (beta-lactamase class C family)
MNTSRRTFIKQAGWGLAGLGLVSPGALDLLAASDGRLPRATPESQGVATRGILDFLEGIRNSGHEFHSFMVVRHGHVVAEGWWAPYRADVTHMMYSMSKSFTSTAIGFAVAEGRLKVDDRVVKFFPGELPGIVSENLAALRVKDLLSMSVGHAQDSIGAVVQSRNWVKTFLAQPVTHKPGTEFMYNSGATYLLSAIVQKVTGQRVADYLRPRLFEPLGVEGMWWDECPMGINTGGWGLHIQTEGLAKFGQLFLRKGVWNGRRILPEKWVEEATSFKIQQPGGPKDDNDWLQGYCYQFWRARHNAYRGDGAFGQYTIVMPDQDAVVAITSETSDMQGELNLVWNHLLPAMQGKSLPADLPANAVLRSRLSALALRPPTGQTTSPEAGRVSGKVYELEYNDLGIRRLTLEFYPGGARMIWRDARGSQAVECGLERWVLGKSSLPFPTPNLVKALGPFKPVGSKIAASGTWKDAHTFQMMWRYYETPHHDTVTCHFDSGELKVAFLDSLTQMNPQGKDARAPLTGWMKET